MEFVKSFKKNKRDLEKTAKNLGIGKSTAYAYKSNVISLGLLEK